jgi:hypothetical protein
MQLVFPFLFEGQALSEPMNPAALETCPTLPPLTIQFSTPQNSTENPGACTPIPNEGLPAPEPALHRDH